nr:hypothetical protein [Tanacetum cinerariifolium]
MEDEEKDVGATEKITMLLKYLEHQMHLLEEVEAVAVVVETHKEFLLCGGGGIVVVVMTAEVVVVDVGSGEPDCDVVRSITGVGFVELKHQWPLSLCVQGLVQHEPLDLI